MSEILTMMLGFALGWATIKLVFFLCGERRKELALLIGGALIVVAALLLAIWR